MQEAEKNKKSSYHSFLSVSFTAYCSLLAVDRVLMTLSALASTVGRNRQADLPGRLQIDNELEIHRLLDGSSAGFAPFRILSTTQRPTNASYPCIDHQQNRSRPAL